MKLNFFTSFLLVCFFSSPLLSSGQQKSLASWGRGNFEFVPAWTDNIKVSSKFDLNKKISGYHFEGASMDPELLNLPFYEVHIPVKANQELTLSNVSSKGVQSIASLDYPSSLLDNKSKTLNGNYPGTYVKLGVVSNSRESWYQPVYIYPVQLESGGLSVSRASSISFSYSFVPKRTTPNNAQRTTATESPLASGLWKKIALTDEGIYRLDYNYFNDVLGINPANIDPRNIQLFGTGGLMLPQRVGDYNYENFPEMAIKVVGESDGVFDQNDYVLFYGASPHKWRYFDDRDLFIHFQNIYSDTSFYFLTVNQPGNRLESKTSLSSTDANLSEIYNYSFYEKEKYNPLKSGRTWMGERFDFNPEQSFSLPTPNILPGSDINYNIRVGAKSLSKSSFSFFADGASSSNASVLVDNVTDSYGDYDYKNDFVLFSKAAIPGKESTDIMVQYQKTDPGGIGYLDYIEVVYEKNLSLPSGQSSFFSTPPDTGGIQSRSVNLSVNNPAFEIWDVSDPINVKNQSFSTNGNTLEFGFESDQEKRFASHNGGGYSTPLSVKTLPNQNIHGQDFAEYIIVTHPDFKAAAEDLANHHRTNSKHLLNDVQVTDVFQIFNEFSGGAPDPSGIRNYFRMWAEQSGDESMIPKYVLFMGDGSYDYKYISNEIGTNFVPSYQSRKSILPTQSYTSDDFYGFLSIGEGFWGEGTANEGGRAYLQYQYLDDYSVHNPPLDVSIGRIPSSSLSEAQAVVDKIKMYQSTESFGLWTNKIVLVSDHKDSDGNTHISQSESYPPLIAEGNPCINIEKVHMDNYEQVRTANGERFPDGKKELLRRLEEGSLIVNYTGHGGETGWSNAKILEIPDINNIRNNKNLPVYITATCEFGRWDDPKVKAGAEKIFLLEENGSIAMFTTVRVVYSYPNWELNKNFYGQVFKYNQTENRMPTMGEVFKNTKNASWTSSINNRNFTLMGDPALTLRYPELMAYTTKINDISVVDTVIDTLKTLSLVSVKGEVLDKNGLFQSTYNGDLQITVYDKPVKQITRSTGYVFYLQRNKLFNGQASIQNGKFSFEFVMPKEVSFDNGLGKMSFYFQNSSQDGGGCYKNIYIGGVGEIVDDTPPEIEVYMNDEEFVDGGITGSNSNLFVKVRDDHGINTAGVGIGHELTGVLDDEQNDVYILNDYYSSAQDDYKAGTIDYPLKDLEDGFHDIEVKVWDVANNSSEGRVTFVVASEANVALGHVLNYPNPFTTNTEFIIEHNQNGKLVDVSVKIFTPSGKMVKSLEETVYADGNIYRGMNWDGLDEWGNAIGKGVYVYKVSLIDKENSIKATKFEKLVLLR